MIKITHHQKGNYQTVGTCSCAYYGTIECSIDDFKKVINEIPYRYQIAKRDNLTQDFNGLWVLNDEIINDKKYDNLKKGDIYSLRITGSYLFFKMFNLLDKYKYGINYRFLLK